MLLPQDLTIIYQLVGNSNVAVSNISAVLPSLQRLEAAMRSGLVHAPVQPEAPPVDAEAPASAGGTE